ncbi:MAG: penicillin-binding protein 2 [Actinomycetota bacterium]|jgi:penicillin-binding protein 2
MPDPQGSAHLRLTIVGIVVFSLFATLLSRATYLQAMDSGAFVKQARENRVRIVYEPAPRGRILDRNNQVLVDNKVSNVITLSREQAAKDDEVIDRLAALLHIQRSDIEAKVKDQRFSPFTPVPVITEAPEEAIVYIREHQSDFEGVDAARVTERSYPYGTLAAHLLGYVGKLNERELSEHRRDNYQPSDEIGKSGVELLYEKWLRGTPGVTRLEVDSADRVVRTLFHTDPVPGHDIRLTLDLNVQVAAEAAMARAMNAAHGTYDRGMAKDFIAPAGAAVVLDPRDGSVRAMASLPTFNPGDFVGGITTPQYQALTAPQAHFPLNNRALAGEYSPGSTFKLATAVAAVNTRMLDPRKTIVDGGKYTVAGCAGDRCVFHNANNEAHGPVNLTTAITVSSDVFFYGLGDQFWKNRNTYGTTAIQDTARSLGFGAKTGIGLGEHAGRVPTPDLRAALHDANPKAFPTRDWRTGDNINLSIGQGELVVTPIQLARAYATFAKDGKAFVPRVASEALTETENGGYRTVMSFPAVSVPGPIIQPDVKAPIEAGLKGVTSNPRGTAYNAFAGFTGMTVAGKTGTAQVHGKQDTALFAAYAPVEDPQWAVAVVMEEAGFGGSIAAPVARHIFDAVLGRTNDSSADVVQSVLD